jgi:hypothetical protein
MRRSEIEHEEITHVEDALAKDPSSEKVREKIAL